ncbi:MAG: guanylate kinase [Saprospiraceae bacterium]|nr:guanylate kinase [Bacteroidia bacterium]NNE16717.1 guanylate kinase [Saprospiraceae bacterium]NNL90826.1 guanylate kinase [Saprospiraceae bacterium]
MKYDMVVFTAPSGAGKTTIVRHLLEKYKEHLGFSISATTREKRPKETDGVDYYFLDHDTFKEKIKNGDFVEWEEVYENQYYGTLKSEIDRQLDNGKKLLFDIEVRGAESLKVKYKERCLVVFVKPPSFRTLIQRLINRKTESAKSFERRVKRIKKELLFEHAFDKVLLNDALEETLANAETLIEKHMLP